MPLQHYALRLHGRRGLAAPAAVLLGALMTPGFAPYDVWPLALVALAGFTALLWACPTWRSAAVVSYLFGLGHLVTSLFWIATAFQQAPSPTTALLGVPAVVGLCAYLAIFPMLVGTASWFLPRKAAVWPVGFAALWLAGEELRVVLTFGFPWNSVGYIANGDDALLQGASLVGVWGLTLIFVFIGAAFAMRSRILPLVALTLLAVLYTFGELRLKGATVADTDLRLRLVQANIAQAHKWDPVRRMAQLKAHVDLSRQEADIRPDVVIWPETAFAFFLDEDPRTQRALADGAAGSVLATGLPRREPGRRYYNSLAVVDAGGEVLAMYDKRLLVPFGEFVPLRGLLPGTVQKLTHGAVDYQRGDGPVRLPLPKGITAVPLICYEAIFPGFVALHSQEADLLLNVTNDAWFQGTGGPAQHFAMARMRAVETGLPLVRVANTGITAVVDGYGRVTHRLEMDQPGVLDVTLPHKNNHPTIFERGVALFKF
jgi:apolipoprotein N-acyltransferase